MRRLKPAPRASAPGWTGALACVALLLATATAIAEPRHGLSAFGELKYPPEFQHFDYVNPDAPKGGRLSMIGTAGRITYDSFNNFILKGDAAQGLEYLFDSLMTRAQDEPDAVYGLIAESAEVAPDGKSVTFHLRPEAKFADGSPVTTDDVVFSFATLKEKGHPNYVLSLRDVEKAEALDKHTVRYTFKGDLTRDLPLIVAELPVLSKAYYTEHPFDQTSLDKPLGSGPYEIADFKPGTYVTYKRRPDYWAKDLPVNRGRFNFDELRYEYYRDRNLELEGLLSGTFDLREEFTSLDWATRYDVPLSKMAASFASCCPMSGRRVLRASSSIRGASLSRTSACARRSDWRSTSSGRTRTCSSNCTRAPRASLRTRR